MIGGARVPLNGTPLAVGPLDSHGQASTLDRAIRGFVVTAHLYPDLYSGLLSTTI